MKILAIETSCDETSIALVECSGTSKNSKFRVLQNIVSSQIAVHAPFGGVVPNLAKREHIKNLPKVLKTLERKVPSMKFDAIAVTVGPGLEPALWTGIEFAKKLAEETGKPLLGTNHMEGHLYSNWLDLKGKKPMFPAIALVVSGGHTILLRMDSFLKWKKLGETRDDAAGEAFDKVARMLALPYPGGPSIEKLARKGNADAIDFPQPMRDAANYDFSYSGLKTAVLYYLRDSSTSLRASNQFKADVAASFQRAATDVLVHKVRRAAEEFGAKSILLSGGVAANKTLRKKLSVLSRRLKVDFFVPPFEYNTDNAAMIGAAAYVGILRKKKYRITAQSNLTL